MTIESDNGVHIKERTQASPDKSKAEQYAEFHKLDYERCASDTVEDVNKRGKVKVING